MSQRLIWLLLVAIIIFAAAIRLHDLSSVPPSPYLDEVSNGYNAYSLLKTGKDEYGRHMPLLLQAYNDFRPALFVYTLIPFVATFGLTTFAIRLPAVILSVLTTLSIFFLTKFLFGGFSVIPGQSEEAHSQKHRIDSSAKPQNDGGNYAEIIGLLAGFLFAISPWSIYSSHISDEINMSLSFFVFAMTFFVLWRSKRHASSSKGRKNNLIFASDFLLLVSIVFFVLAFYAYHGIKFFLPFFIIVLACLYWRELWSKKKTTIIGFFLGIILLIPLALAFLAPGALNRLGGVNNPHPELLSLGSQRVLYDKTHADNVGAIFDNRRLLFSLEYFNDYLRNLDVTWLFLPQGNVTFLVPDVGPMYLFTLPLLLLGIYFLIRDRTISGRTKLLLLLWILLSPIPASLSSESPHLNRINTILPALTIVEAVGFFFLITLIVSLRSFVVRILSFIVVGCIILFSVGWFAQAYFVDFPHEQSKVYQYGAIQAFRYAKVHEDQYDKIIVSNHDTLLEGYMYYLFATKFDPETYQKMGGTGSAFFTDQHFIGKYQFIDLNFYKPESVSHPERILYIVNPGELSQTIINQEHLQVVQRFYFLNGQESLDLLAGKISSL